MRLFNNKKHIITSLAIVSVVVLCFLIGLSFLTKNSQASTYVGYMDNISDLQMFTSKQELVKLSEFDKNKLLVYLSSNCGSCIEVLPLLNKINSIYCTDQNVELIVLWEDDIPLEHVTKADLEKHSLSLGGARISTTLGIVFFVDENNDVIFVDDSEDYSNVLSFMADNVDYNKEQMIIASNNYIINNISHATTFPQLIYFSLPGCPDCAEANNVVFSNDLEKIFSITKIERDRDALKNDIIDELDIFRTVYDIDWYPSFLVIRVDGSWDIVRKVDIADLHDILLNLRNSN